MIIQICVGSSCHLKGSQEIVELFQNAIEEYRLSDDVALVGSFCIGQCNRTGVTVQIDDTVFPGVTPEDFSEFFNSNVLDVAKKERKGL